MLPDEQISQFQTLYKNRFGIEIGREEACEKGAKLIQLVRFVYKPIAKEDLSALQQNYEINREKV